MSYIKQNKKHKQILGSAQYRLEIIFKVRRESSWYEAQLVCRTFVVENSNIYADISSQAIAYPYLAKLHETTELGSVQVNF